MATYTLTVIEADNKDKKRDGTPYVGKYGPFFYSTIRVNELAYPLKGFPKHAVRPGDVIEADVTEEEYNGKTEYKFKILKSKGNAAGARSVTPPATAPTANDATVAILREQLSVHRMILDKIEAMYLTMSTVQTMRINKKQRGDAGSSVDASDEEEFGIPGDDIDFGDAR